MAVCQERADDSGERLWEGSSRGYTVIHAQPSEVGNDFLLALQTWKLGFQVVVTSPGQPAERVSNQRRG